MFCWRHKTAALLNCNLLKLILCNCWAVLSVVERLNIIKQVLINNSNM